MRLLAAQMLMGLCLLTLAACTDLGFATGVTFDGDGASVQNSVTGTSGNTRITIGN